MTVGNRTDLLADYEYKDETAGVSDKDVEDIAQKKQLVVYEDQIRKQLGKFKRSIYDIGRLLYHAKHITMVHGAFQLWVKTRFGDDFSYPSAVNFMKIYKYFQLRPEVVEMVPMTYLLTIIREFKDEAVDKLDNMMKEGGVPEVRKRLTEMFKKEKEENPYHKRKEPVEKIDPLEKIIDKYKDERHVRYYDWLLKAMIVYTKRTRRLNHDYNPFPLIMKDLQTAPFTPEKTLDMLKKMEAEGFLEDVKKAKQFMQLVEESFVQALEYFEKESNK